jgi:hypothetical protein
MSVRSLNGLNGTNTNLIITNNYVARLPIEQTQASCLDPVYIGLKGLSAMGTENQIMKVNSNNELAWATDNNEIITATLPLLKTNSDISLKGITAFGGVGKILKVNSTNDAFEWGTDNNDPSKWILTGTNLYPISTGTNVVIGATTNTDNRDLFVSGDAEVNNFYAKNILLNNGTTQSYIRFYDMDATGPEHIDLKANNGTTATNHTLFLPADTDGTLLVENSNITFGDLGSGATSISYIYDPSAGALSTTNNAFAFHSNGTEVDLNCRVAFGGTSSAVNLKFAGSIKYRFNENLTMVVGSNAFSFPSSSGTLAKVGETSNWSVSSNIISPNPTTVNRIKLFGTDTAVYGDITNPFSPSFGYIKTGAFYDLRANSCGAETFIVGKFYGSPVQFTSTTLSCSQGQNLLLTGNSIAEYYDQDNSISWIQDASLSNQRVLRFFSPIFTGTLSYCCSFQNGSNATNYARIKNDNGDFIIEMKGVGDILEIATTGDTTINTVLNVKTHFQVDIDGTWGVGNHALRDPNSTANDTDYFLQYQTSGLNTVLNCGSSAPSASCGLYVGGTVKFSTYPLKTVSFVPMDINGNITMTAGDTVDFRRFKISQNGGITKINNPAGDNANAQRNIIEYHNDGTYLNLVAPSDGTTDSNYISNYIGTVLKLKIGGATTTSYNPMICEGGLTSNSSGARMGFQDTLPGYGTTAYGTVVAEQAYGYFVSNSVPGTGVGGTYDAYWGGGAIGGTSDIRMKKNINTIENPIDIIKRLRGVNFEWKCEGKPTGVQIGYIAQEVKEVIPSIVDFLPTKCEMCPDGTYGVAPMNISAVLVEGIKAQQIEIDTLKTELDTYKSIVDKLLIAKSFVDFKKSL